jgi:hypothetical protein
MGRKGVSKRKPKKAKSSSNDNLNRSSNTRPGESSSVPALIRDASVNPAAGTNKKNRKGK